jgi:hypothetical protein
MTTDFEHARVAGLLSEYAAGTLSATDRAAVTAHVATCTRCQHSLAEWSALRIAVQGASPVVTPGREVLAGVHARIAVGQVGQNRTLAFLFRLLLAQVPLVRPQIWAASALVMCLGIAVTFVLRQGADAYLAVIAPVVAAAGVGFIYGPDNDPPLEVILATPTSPRLILLARLALVFGYDFALALGLSIVLALSGQASGGLQDLMRLWLGPMLLLSAISLALSLRLGSAAGVSIALTLWAVRVMLSMNTGPFGPSAQQALTFIGSTNVITLLAAAAILMAAVFLLPRKEQFA